MHCEDTSVGNFDEFLNIKCEKLLRVQFGRWVGVCLHSSVDFTFPILTWVKAKEDLLALSKEGRN
jgi:hypothetical protein